MKLNLTLITLFLWGVTTAQMESPDFSILDSDVLYDNVSNSLTKTTNGWGNGGAFSSNMLESGKSGIVEYVLNGVTDIKVIGISDEAVLGLGIASMDYGFLLSAGMLFLLEDGRVTLSLGTKRTGTRLGVNITSGTVQFEVDGSVVRSSPLTSGDYVISTLMFNDNANFTGIKTSFPLPRSIENNQYTELLPLPNAFIKTTDSGFCFSFRARKARDAEHIVYRVYDRNHDDLSGDTSLDHTDIRIGSNLFCMTVEGLANGVYTLEVELSDGTLLYSKFKRINSPIGNHEGPTGG